MEIEMKKAKKLDDGIHHGEIVSIKYDTEPYEYTRICVKTDSNDMELEYSAPTNLSENSKLMRVLKAFGVEFVAEKKIDPETILKGQKVQFQVINKPSKKDGNIYSEIVEDSLKPTKIN